MDKLTIGKKGEDSAADFLTRKGYMILDRNYRKSWGELDIVAQKGNLLRFVEVKTVCRDNLETGAGTDDYEPEDNLHFGKRRRLSRIIETYLWDKNLDEEAFNWQIDVMSVYLDSFGKLIKLDWLEDVDL